MSLRGLWHLTWLEMKIFIREPMGAIGTLLLPVLAFVVLGRTTAGRLPSVPGNAGGFLGRGGVPVVVSILIANSAVLSLVTIISIYREGGILKRLRATPLRPYTILSAHVLVKLILTALTMFLLVLAGKRYFAAGPGVPIFSFGLAVLLSTFSILALGFIIASLVPNARFAQPIGAFILYPMIGLSGLFVAVDAMPAGMRMIARVLPTTYAVSLLQGIWLGEGWIAHAGDVAALALAFVVGVAISARVFRWE